MTGPVLAAHRWRSNAEMIADVARLGYLDGRVLDPTYGRGTWWKRWQPVELVTHDLALDGVDFTALPEPSGSFDAVAFDPPYKLNGTATPEVDARYGVERYAPWQAKHRLIRGGLDECARVTRPGGYVLLKCQDQVCSGAIRWQTFEFVAHAGTVGLALVDKFDLLGGRAQPSGRRQVHAYYRPSTLLVFRRA